MLKMQSILCEDCRKKLKETFFIKVKGVKGYEYAPTGVPKVCDKCRALMASGSTGYRRDYIPEAF